MTKLHLPARLDSRLSREAIIRYVTRLCHFSQGLLTHTETFQVHIIVSDKVSEIDVSVVTTYVLCIPLKPLAQCQMKKNPNKGTRQFGFKIPLMVWLPLVVISKSQTADKTRQRPSANLTF